MAASCCSVSARAVSAAANGPPRRSAARPFAGNDLRSGCSKLRPENGFGPVPKLLRIQSPSQTNLNLGEGLRSLPGQPGHGPSAWIALIGPQLPWLLTGSACMLMPGGTRFLQAEARLVLYGIRTHGIVIPRCLPDRCRNARAKAECADRPSNSMPCHGDALDERENRVGDAQQLIQRMTCRPCHAMAVSCLPVSCLPLRRVCGGLVSPPIGSTGQNHCAGGNR